MRRGRAGGIVLHASLVREAGLSAVCRHLYGFCAAGDAIWVDRQLSDGYRRAIFKMTPAGERRELGEEMLRGMLLSKMKVEKPLLLIAIALAGLAMLAAPLPAFSQSCALCYTQAASAGGRMIQALRSGILILIVPPTLMSVGMIFIVHHKRNQVRRDDDTPDSDRTW